MVNFGFATPWRKGQGQEHSMTPQSNANVYHNEKQISNDAESLSSSELPSGKEASEGVQKAEAVNQLWSTGTLVLAYLLIFLVFFVNSLQQQITGNLTPYVTSAFAKHALIPVMGIVSSLVSGITKLPLAKLLDVWGRTQGFILVVFLTTISLIMMAATNNVETYAAAQVFYWVGFNGMSYVLDVFMADTSSIRNRALVFAFSTTPYIATTFAGPSAAQEFYQHSTWRWAFGAFSIITPVISLPIIILFGLKQRKAKQQGLVALRNSRRNLKQSIIFYYHEFDFLGLVIIVAGFALFLIPFGIATYQASKWSSATVISMIVIGGVLLIVFPFYEKYVARKSFVPWELLTDRTVIGACLLAGTLFVSFYCWDSYYTSYLQVVHGLSIKDAGYVANIYNIGSCFWSVVVAILIRLTNRFKWLALSAIPLMLLGVGLLIHFRQPESPLGYVVMCQIFIAFSGGTLVICQEIAIMAAAKHEQVAVVLALLSVFTGIGQAVGQSISGAIWTNTLYQHLKIYLPDDVKSQALDIYGSLPTQLSYPRGSPTREAIIAAYGVTQKRMTIVATSVTVLAFVWVAIWRDINVKQVKQVRGRIF